VPIDELKGAGCTVTMLRDGGFKLGVIKAHFGCAELREAGYTPYQLKLAGFGPTTLREAGCTAEDLRNGGFTALDLKNAGYAVDTLRSAGYSATSLEDVGFSAKELRDAGYPPKEMKMLSFSAEEFRVAGYSATELREMGLRPKELREGGFTMEDIKSAGYTAWQLRDSFPQWMIIGKLKNDTAASAASPRSKSPTTARGGQAGGASSSRAAPSRANGVMDEHATNGEGVPEHAANGDGQGYSPSGAGHDVEIDVGDAADTPAAAPAPAANKGWLSSMMETVTETFATPAAAPPVEPHDVERGLLLLIDPPAQAYSSFSQHSSQRSGTASPAARRAPAKGTWAGDDPMAA
jgi:hypothetical protein